MKTHFLCCVASVGMNLSVPARGADAVQNMAEFNERINQCLSIAREPSLSAEMGKLEKDDLIFRFIFDTQADGVYIITCRLTHRNPLLTWSHISVGLSRPSDIFAVPQKLQDVGQKRLTDNEAGTLGALLFAGMFFERPLEIATEPGINEIGIRIEGVGRGRCNLIDRSGVFCQTPGFAKEHSVSIAESHIESAITYILGISGADIRLF